MRRIVSEFLRSRMFWKGAKRFDVIKLIYETVHNVVSPPKYCIISLKASSFLKKSSSKEFREYSSPR